MWPFVLSIVISLFAFASESISTKLKTPRGAEVEVWMQLPEGTEKVPAIVAAPGRGYHAGLPIFLELSGQAPRQGLAIVRFNWNYFSEGKEPSKDLSSEVEDLETVLKFVKEHPRVRADRILLSGKSLGSIVAYKVFQTSNLHALNLLTPICSNREEMDAYYPNVAGEKRPVLFLFGSGDREACTIETVVSTMRQGGSNLQMAVVLGDHGLNIGNSEDNKFAEMNSLNIESSMNLLVQWAKAVLAD